jgi:hypothetical protein
MAVADGFGGWLWRMALARSWRKIAKFVAILKRHLSKAAKIAAGFTALHYTDPA